MTTSRSKVLIPLLGLGEMAQGGQLVEIYCQQQMFGATVLDNKAIEKEWGLITAELRRFGLQADGELAVNSVRKLGLNVSKTAIYQRFKPFAWLDDQRLHCAHVFDKEGDSAQLGLAIALLLNASNSPFRCAIATGKLSNEVSENHWHENDTAVEAVNGIPSKLALIKALRHRLPQGPLFCFTPVSFKEDGEIVLVENLPIVEELAALSVSVKPIRWLSEAAKILQAQFCRRLPKDHWWAAGVGLVLAISSSIGLYVSWRDQLIPIEILSGEHHKAEPFLVCVNRDNTEVSYHDLPRDGGIPLLPLFAGENQQYNTGLGLELRPASTLLTDRYFAVVIHLGEKTGIKIINRSNESRQDFSVAANQLWQKYWPMEEIDIKPENAVLLVGLQRESIDTDKLNAEFQKRFSNTGFFSLLEARDYLLDKFPGSYAFIYKVIIGDSPCIRRLF